MTALNLLIIISKKNNETYASYQKIKYCLSEFQYKIRRDKGPYIGYPELLEEEHNELRKNLTKHLDELDRLNEEIKSLR